MGMAASQARFLQLTARRSNIEYQGQQINQQRLALANASAGLFEKMLTLAVPTPPSSQDDKYYTQGYNFTDPVDDIQKKISWSPEPVVTADFPTDVPVGGGQSSITVTSPAGVNTYFSSATLVAAGSVGTSAAEIAARDAALNSIATAMGVSMTAEQKILGYTQVVRNVTIEHNIYTPDGQFSTIQVTTPALLEFDNLNRLLSVSVLDKSLIDRQDTAALADKPRQVKDGDKLTYASVFDDKAYANDMNKYEFQKAAYDYQIERINQETKQVQVQDKSLELKMKQLDTEHNAVQTEMEAVQKVIQKNIESSFKTFA